MDLHVLAINHDLRMGVRGLRVVERIGRISVTNAYGERFALLTKTSTSFPPGCQCRTLLSARVRAYTFQSPHIDIPAQCTGCLFPM